MFRRGAAKRLSGRRSNRLIPKRVLYAARSGNESLASLEAFTQQTASCLEEEGWRRYTSFGTCIRWRTVDSTDVGLAFLQKMDGSLAMAESEAAG